MNSEYIRFDDLEDEPLETRIVEKLIELFCTKEYDMTILMNEELMLLLAKYRSRISYLNKLYYYEQKYKQLKLEVE